MRALGFKVNGGPEVLEEVDVPVPEPGPGQVLIEVEYSGVDFAEIQHRRGEFGPPDGYDIPGLEDHGQDRSGDRGADLTGTHRT